MSNDYPIDENSLAPDQGTQGESINELVRQIQLGIDVEENFRKIYSKYFRSVRYFFERYGPAAEDLSQEVFVRAFRSIDTFRGDSEFARWLFQIAGNVYRNELRSRTAWKRDVIEESLDAEDVADFAAGDPSPIDEIIMRERLSALRTGLHTLPAQMRRCFELRYNRGLKYNEIATVMAISIDTVKAHLHQARQRLAKELRATNGD